MAKKLVTQGYVSASRGNEVYIVLGPREGFWAEGPFVVLGSMVTLYWYDNKWQIAEEKAA